MRIVGHRLLLKEVTKMMLNLIVLLISSLFDCIKFVSSYLQQHYVETKVKFQVNAGKLLTYAAVIVGKYFNIYQLDASSMYQNQYIMLGKTELTGTTIRLKRNWEIKIFNQFVSEGGNAIFIRNIFAYVWMFSFGEYHSYETFKSILKPTPIIYKLGYSSLSAMYSASLVFLLVDDSSEAFGFCKQIEENKIPPSMSVVFYILLQNGTYRMIKNWNLKICAAMQLITSVMTEDTKMKTKEEANFSNIIQKSRNENIDPENLQEFGKILTALDGKSQFFLSNFRIKFFRYFCSVAKILSKKQQNEYKEKIVSSFYSANDSMLHLSKFPFLTILLKLLSDGQLHKEQQLQKFKGINFDPITSNSKIRSCIDNIKFCDSEIIKSSNISPHFNLLGGRRLHRGMCLIINQTFETHPNFYRAGTEKDEKDLKRAWEYLGCKNNVRIMRDLDKLQMLNELKSFRNDLRERSPDYCVICILGHGNLNKKKRRDEVMDANFEMVSMSKIKNMIVDGKQCPVMIGKPKLFFVQACRGKENQNMIDTDMSETDGEEGSEDLEENRKKFINKSWFFVFQSTVKGFASNRHPQNGTIFIQNLCTELMENGRKMNLSTLASSVNQRIMRQFNIQAPIYENQLGDFIYFQPYD